MRNSGVDNFFKKRGFTRDFHSPSLQVLEIFEENWGGSSFEEI